MTAVYKSKAGLSFWSLERRPDCHLSPWSVRPLGLQVQGPIVIWVLGEPALRGSTGRRSDCHFGPWREGPIVILVLGEPALRGSAGQRPRLSFGSLECQAPGSTGPRPCCQLGPRECSSPGLQVDGAIIKVSDADGAGRPSRAGRGT